MAHTPHTPEAPLPDTKAITSAMAAYLAATITEEQVKDLIRIFANFQRNVVREAPATSLPTSEGILP